MGKLEWEQETLGDWRTTAFKTTCLEFSIHRNGEMIWVFGYNMTKEQGNNTMNHLVGGFNPAEKYDVYPKYLEVPFHL